MDICFVKWFDQYSAPYPRPNEDVRKELTRILQKYGGTIMAYKHEKNDLGVYLVTERWVKDHLLRQKNFYHQDGKKIVVYPPKYHWSPQAIEDLVCKETILRKDAEHEFQIFLRTSSEMKDDSVDNLATLNLKINNNHIHVASSGITNSADSNNSRGSRRDGGVSVNRQSGGEMSIDSSTLPVDTSSDSRTVARGVTRKLHLVPTANHVAASSTTTAPTSRDGERSINSNSSIDYATSTDDPILRKSLEHAKLPALVDGTVESGSASHKRKASMWSYKGTEERYEALSSSNAELHFGSSGSYSVSSDDFNENTVSKNRKCASLSSPRKQETSMESQSLEDNLRNTSTATLTATGRSMKTTMVTSPVVLGQIATADDTGNVNMALPGKGCDTDSNETRVDPLFKAPILETPSVGVPSIVAKSIENKSLTVSSEVSKLKMPSSGCPLRQKNLFSFFPRKIKATAVINDESIKTIGNSSSSIPSYDIASVVRTNRLHSNISPIYSSLKAMVLEEAKIDPNGSSKALIRFVENPTTEFLDDQVLQSIIHAFMVRSSKYEFEEMRSRINPLVNV